MRLVVAALLLVASLAGCASNTDPAAAEITAYQHESATYDVLTGNRSHVGTATITLTIEGERVRIEGTFSPNEGAGSRAEAVADARTGERLYRDGQDMRHYFWGASMVFPSDPFSASGGVELMLDAYQAAPEFAEFFGPPFGDLLALVGPQWIVLRGASHEEYHGVDVRAAATPEGHRVLATAPCPDKCPASHVGLGLVQDWLLRDGLLPAEIHHHDGGGDGVRFVRTEHEVRDPMDLTVSPPSSRAAAPAMKPLCNGLPCESDSWRQDMSPGRVLAAIEATPGWVSWREAHPNAVLSAVSATNGNYVPAADPKAGEMEGGSARYTEQDHGTDGFGIHWPAAIGPLPLSSTSHRPWHNADRMPAVPEAAIPLHEAASHAAGLFGLDLAELSSLGIHYAPPEGNPDPRAQAKLSLNFNADNDIRANKALLLSLIDGTVFYATHHLPELAEDPNR